MQIVLRITQPVSVMSGGMSVVILMQLGTFLLYLVQDLPRRLLAPKAPGVPGPRVVHMAHYSLRVRQATLPSLRFSMETGSKQNKSHPKIFPKCFLKNTNFLQCKYISEKQILC